MKKIIIGMLLCILYLNSYAQNALFSGSSKFEFNVSVVYETKKNGLYYIYDRSTKKYNFRDSTFVKFQKVPEVSSLGFAMAKFDNDKRVNSLDYGIKNSDSFNDEIVYSSLLGDKNNRWVPIWYFEALEENNRDLVLKAEPKRLTWDADIAPTVWYDDIPEVASVVLSNCGMTFYTPLEDKNTGFLFSELKKMNDTTYEVTAYPAVQDNNEDISWEPYKENFPFLKDGNPVKFRYEINGKCMKVYNADNNKIVFNLIQMSAEWVELYEDFIRTNIIPEDLILPEEYLNKVSSEKRTITDTSLSVGSLLCTVDALRLRETEQITSRIITTMSKGTLVKILEIGSKQTIDGIASNWVKIEVIPVGRDVEGKRLYEDTTGWCFGGYLE